MGRKKEVPDEELLAVARRCFLENGPGTATGVVAKAAGVSQATLFNRFESKKKMMILALAPSIPPLVVKLLSSAPDERPIDQQLAELSMHMYKGMRENEPGVNVLRAAGITWRELFEMYDEFPPVAMMRKLINWLRTAQDAGRISATLSCETIAMVFAGSVRNLAFDEFYKGIRKEPELVQQYIKMMLHMLWNGMSPRSEGDTQAPSPTPLPKPLQWEEAMREKVKF